MNIPRVFQELFIHCGEISDTGLNWSSLGFTGKCPYAFSNEEIIWNKVQQLAQESLDTDADRWVAPQLDIQEKQRQNTELLSLFIE
ncbi:hypothetical protein P175DRAFT_0512729 [Aspergillus ochraceoroseus IBT 24754]|uniref:Uncharacterized protein n=1 Tax=Aspergillus ochraceoroseus IBT 24754 TaxID=1392256 RepID=A0A2T5LKV1_9EURO|nr:uncharacterized protein P175DRAFT_0512729 [Aspergillus ochraceoroseus IBT 24754]PTU16913.1 hypothetical protein P175DRAFT_0512729 [Aspergillus ochraceoroseus IBT 24754]